MKIQQISEALLGRTPSILGHEQFMKFAVLLPLVEVNNEVHILFEVRAQTLRRQPGVFVKYIVPIMST